jgi:iron(III) transport system ATP-binding protein
VVTEVDGDLVSIRLGDGSTIHGSASRTSPGLPLARGNAVGVTIRAEAIRPASQTDTQNVVNGTVTDVEYAGATLSCELETPIGALLLDLTGAGIRPTLGDRLSVLLPAASIYFVTAEPGA